jgi:hypothetical protein
MMRAWYAPAGFALALLVGPNLAQSASAEPVTLNFEVAVTSTFGDFAAIFGAPLAPADIFRGSLTYDTATPDSAPADPEVGDYRSAGAIVVSVGSGLSVPLETVFVSDNAFSPLPNMDDGFGAIAFTPAVPGFESILTTVDFRGGGRTGDALPASAAEALAAFSTGSFRLTGLQTGVNPPFDSGTHELFGLARLLDASPEPVPEPGTVLLFAAGAGMMFWRWRRLIPTA